MIVDNNNLSLREFHLLLPEVESNQDVYQYAEAMCLALSRGIIDSNQFELLAGSLEIHARKEGLVQPVYFL